MRKDLQTKLRDLLRQNSQRIIDPAGREIEILGDDRAINLSHECDCRVHEVYVVALNQGIYPYRYIRNREAISLQEQLRLALSRVAVVGAGGLGGQVILLLARLGVGCLVVVDSDVFDESNLNRQVLCTETALGKSKAEQAVAVVGLVNHGVEVISWKRKLDSANASEMLEGSDVIVDALDNMSDRFILENMAKGLGIPLVHGALAGFAGQLMTIFPDDAGLKQLYGSERVYDKKSLRPESVLGVPGITPALIATLQAMEVLKIILKRGKIFRNVMMHVDLENGELNEFIIGNHDVTVTH